MPSFRWREPSPFPARRLPGLDGAERDLSEAWRAGPAVLAIGHADCPTSQLTLPFVERLFRRRPPGLHALVILQDEPAVARDLAARLGLTLPVVLEPDPYPLAVDLALRSVPVTWLVGSDGRIRRAIEGFSRDEMERLAAEAGLEGPLFGAEDAVPPRRPG